MKLSYLLVIISLLLLFSGTALASDALNVELTYDTGELDASYYETEAYVSDFSTSGPYTLRTVNESGKTLYSKQFDIDRRVFTGEGSIKLNRTDKELIVPKQDGVAEIQIYHNGELADTLQVGSQTSISDEKMDQPKTESNKSRQQKTTKTSYNIPVIASVALGLILFVVLALSVAFE